MTSATETPQVPEHQKAGNDFFRKGEFAKAAHSYTKAIKENPTNHALYSNRAAAFLKMSNPKQSKALVDADKCIQLDPTFVKGYFRKAGALTSLRRWDLALDTLKIVMSLDPENKEVNRLMKEVLVGKTASIKNLHLVQKKDYDNMLNAPVVVDKVEIEYTDELAYQYAEEIISETRCRFAAFGKVESQVHVLNGHSENGVQSKTIIGVKEAFNNARTLEDCHGFLEKHTSDNKSIAAVTVVQKSDISFPKTWINAAKGGKDEKMVCNAEGIFVQLDGKKIRSLWFIPTTKGSLRVLPAEAVKVDFDKFGVMPSCVFKDIPTENLPTPSSI